MKLSLKIIESISEIDKYQNSWDELYNGSGSIASQSSGFTIAAFKYYLNTNHDLSPFIILFFKQSKLVSVFPLLKNGKNLYNYKGASLGGDDFDFLVLSNNYVKQISKSFYKFISESKMNVYIHFLNTSSLFIKYFEYHFRPNSFSYINSEKIQIPLKNNIIRDKLMSGKDRIEKRRILKKISNTKTILYTDLRINELKEFCDYIINNNIRERSYLNENLINFLITGINEKWLKCYQTKIDNKVVAMHFLIVNKDSLITFIDLYDNIPYLNIGIMHRIINMEENKNNSILNLGRGLYDYKVKNFSPLITPITSVIIINSAIQFKLEVLKIIFIKIFRLKYLKIIYKKLKYLKLCV